MVHKSSTRAYFHKQSDAPFKKIVNTFPGPPYMGGCVPRVGQITDLPLGLRVIGKQKS